MWRRVIIGLAAATVTTACAGGPRPGDAGYPYNASGAYTGRLTVRDELFDARLELRTAPGGRVRGSFRVAAPFALDGRVDGRVIDDLLRVTITYANSPQGGCTGRVEGILTVQRGGDVIEGPGTVSDCEDQLPGRMSFRR
jgi:hypothetical protein